VGRAEEFLSLTEASKPAGGVVVLGDPGVGKTRLARAAVDAHYARGARVEWIAGASGAAGLPLGAVAHLVPDADLDTDDTGRLFRVTARALTAPAYGALVLGVDDVHLLDPASAALVHHAVVSGNATVIATARRGYELPEPINALIRDGRLERMNLEPLARPEVDALLSAVLGPDVDGATARKLRIASEGNPMLLRELVEAGLESGALAERDGLWRWDGPLAAPRLLDLVEARLNRLSTDQRQAVELLAIGEPVALDVCEALVPAADIDALDRLNLLESRAVGRATTVQLSHPLYGEVLRGTMSMLQCRSIERRLADALEARPLTDTETLRVVAWRLANGDAVDPDLLVRAGRRALGASDFATAERIARVAVDARGAPVERRLLGMALAGQGRIDEAHAALVGAAHEQEAALLGRALDVFFWGSRTVSAAAAVRRVEQLLADARDWPAEREPLVDAARAGVQLLAGEVGDSRAIADRVLVNPNASTVAQLRALLVAGPGAAIAGCTEEARTHGHRGVALVRAGLADGSSAATDELVELDAEPLLTATSSLAAHMAGRLDEAHAVADDGYRAAVRAGNAAAQGLWALARGHVETERGRVRSAARVLRESAGLLRNPPAVYFVWCLAYLAQTAALSGDVDTARAALDEAESLRSETFQVFDCELARGAAWTAAKSGDSAAADIVLRAADLAEQRGQGAFATLAAHDAARLGAAEPAARQLARLALSVDGEIVTVMSAHATALVNRDTEVLERSSQSFEELGWLLLAAESAAEAMAISDGEGRRDRARVNAARARALADGCEGARTPALRALEGTIGLSPREREIAILAADGHSSRDIATRLHVSVRTVDNHLHRAYTKLGVAGRDELGGTLKRV
jgi:DNA-binding CsgD family transcriptional regulator/tetratricopeptide (TPR) repeat protein